jgi:hypothetical protein
MRRAISNNLAAQKRLRNILRARRWHGPSRAVLKARCYRRIARCQGTCWSAQVHWAHRQYYNHLCHVRRMNCRNKAGYLRALRVWNTKCSRCKISMRRHSFYRYAPLLGCRGQCGNALRYRLLYNFYRRRCH